MTTPRIAREASVVQLGGRVQVGLCVVAVMGCSVFVVVVDRFRVCVVLYPFPLTPSL